MKEKNPIYGGSALGSGLIISKSACPVRYYAAASRADDGEITSTTKIIKCSKNCKGHGETRGFLPVLKRIARKLIPSLVNESSAFSEAVKQNRRKTN